MNELERLGWRVLRFTWEDVRSRPQYVLELIADCCQPQVRVAASAGVQAVA